MQRGLRCELFRLLNAFLSFRFFEFCSLSSIDLGRLLKPSVAPHWQAVMHSSIRFAVRKLEMPFAWGGGGGGEKHLSFQGLEVRVFQIVGHDIFCFLKKADWACASSVKQVLRYGWTCVFTGCDLCTVLYSLFFGMSCRNMHIKGNLLL